MHLQNDEPSIACSRARLLEFLNLWSCGRIRDILCRIRCPQGSNSITRSNTNSISSINISSNTSNRNQPAVAPPRQCKTKPSGEAREMVAVIVELLPPRIPTIATIAVRATFRHREIAGGREGSLPQARVLLPQSQGPSGSSQDRGKALHQRRRRACGRDPGRCSILPQ